MIDTTALEKRIAQIQRELDLRETQDLLEIWEINDREAWTPEAFVAVQRILQARLEELPPQKATLQEVQEKAAQEAAQKKLEQNRQLPLALEHLEEAQYLMMADEFEAALSECESAIQATPAYAPAYNYKGMVLETLGRLDEAVDSYQAALQLDPDFYAARENLYAARIQRQEEEFLLIARGDFEIFEEDYSELAEETDSPLLWDALEDQTGYDPEAPAFYLDASSFLLPGWPGYRTRLGRSGYDYLDTSFELGHMEGLFLRSIFTGRFRTYNPFYLVILSVVGCIYSLPLLFLFLSDISTGDLLVFLFSFLLYYPQILVGIALFVNAGISLLTWNSDRSQSITG